MLEAVEEEDLTTLFGFNNTIHRRIFIQSLDSALIHGVKPPTNLWEYKALYPAYTMFLLCISGHTPRLTVLYLYFYDYPGYSYYTNTIQSCEHDSSLTDESSSNPPYLLSLLLFPPLSNMWFSVCFMDVHYWTSRFIIAQCVLKGFIELVQVMQVLRSASFSFSNEVFSGVKASLLTFAVYYFISCIWWLLPTILADAAFYAELYFSPYFYWKELSKLMRGDAV